MGTQKPRITFAKPVKTRDGEGVKIYEVFEGRYINGAVYDETSDIWFPHQWNGDGTFGSNPCGSDLVNATY